MLSPRPVYEVYALRYGSHAARQANENFLSDPHDDSPMPLDFYIWAIRSGHRTIVVDTGFDADTATKRARRLTQTPASLLRTIGINAADVDDVVLTHMHYDHAGNLSEFPRAVFHIQDAEMAYCTGRFMCHGHLRKPFEAADVVSAVRHLYEGRLRFHNGTGEIAPGVTVHLIGGHTAGLQVVRVATARGWVVLASDAAHYWANIRNRSPFPIVLDVGHMMDGYRKIEELADGPDHVIPGHDPGVLE